MKMKAGFLNNKNQEGSFLNNRKWTCENWRPDLFVE